MNTVYKKATAYSKTIDSKSIAQEYLAYAREISNLMSQLDIIRNKIKDLHDVTNDNGDVAFELGEALSKLGIALATCMVYQGEYQMEADETDSEMNCPKDDEE